MFHASAQDPPPDFPRSVLIRYCIEVLGLISISYLHFFLIAFLCKRVTSFFSSFLFQLSLRFKSAMASKESASNNPGLHTTIDEATKGYTLQQTMLRIKDPKVSLDFYSRIMGMSLLKRLDFPKMGFTLYLLGYEDTSLAPTDPVERTSWTFGQKAVLELTHNWGTESDPDFETYHNGNSVPRGFGHIGITVNDVHEACKRFESLGVEFVKKPNHGKMKDIAFVKDADGYWIEIFDTTTVAKSTANAAV